MKFIKNPKLVLNILIVVLSVIPFFLFIGNYFDFRGSIDSPQISMYSMIVNHSVDASYFSLILISSLLLISSLVCSILTHFKSKSLQNLIIFPICVACNVASIGVLLSLGTIHRFESSIISIIPSMVVAILLLNTVLIAIRFALEFTKEK